MTDIPAIGADKGGPRNIEMRFTMREMLELHRAFQHRYETFAKEAWWLGRRGSADRAQQAPEQANAARELADRLYDKLDGVMDLPRGHRRE